MMLSDADHSLVLVTRDKLRCGYYVLLFRNALRPTQSASLVQFFTVPRVRQVSRDHATGGWWQERTNVCSTVNTESVHYQVEHYCNECWSPSSCCRFRNICNCIKMWSICFTVGNFGVQN